MLLFAHFAVAGSSEVYKNTLIYPPTTTSTREEKQQSRRTVGSFERLQNK
jgi:hypothetical protein